MRSSDTMRDAPLPMRWLDLIQALNEARGQQSDRRRTGDSPPLTNALEINAHRCASD